MPNPKDPQAFNRYSYVLNNPLRYTDPSGQIPIVDINQFNPGPAPFTFSGESDPLGIVLDTFLTSILSNLSPEKAAQFLEIIQSQAPELLTTISGSTDISPLADKSPVVDTLPVVLVTDTRIITPSAPPTFNPFNS